MPLRLITATVLVLACLAAPAAAEPLSPPIERTPRGPIGTVVLLPGSGWASPTRAAQRLVYDHVATTLLNSRFRVSAVDYDAGAAAGLASVKRALAAERRRLRRGPLCVYGESSGGHLALLAAQQMKGVDCVITVGSPTSFTAFAQAAAEQIEHPGYAWAFENIVVPEFGDDPAAWEPWEPARRAMRQPVLIMMCADDPIVPQNQMSQIPTAETYVAPPGDLSDPSQAYVHGSTTPAGRAAIQRRVAEFAERAPRSPLRSRAPAAAG